MKNRYSLGLNFSFYFKSALLAVLITLAQQAFANVGVTLNLWRGYDTFYGQVTIAASSPDPVTYHRVESPNGKIWREYSTTTSVGSFTNLSFSVLLDECTNGVWTLIRNVGDTSAQTNTFSVSLTGITANMFGDITMVIPCTMRLPQPIHLNYNGHPPPCSLKSPSRYAKAMLHTPLVIMPFCLALPRAGPLPRHLPLPTNYS